MMKQAVFLTALALSSFPAGAQEVFTQGGTQGLGVGAALSLGSYFGLHADFNAFTLHHDFTLDNNRYKGDARLRQGGLYLDAFPFKGHGWRITAGVRLNDDTLDALSTPDNGTYYFNGKNRPAVPGADATASAKYPTAMPYFGLGFGHRPQSKGFGFVADIGVAYGVPKTTYTLSPLLQQLAGPKGSASIQASGEQELKDKAWRYRWYPVAQVGVSYRF
jgi:hypothetical protein